MGHHFKSFVLGIIIYNELWEDILCVGGSADTSVCGFLILCSGACVSTVYSCCTGSTWSSVCNRCKGGFTILTQLPACVCIA